jgi:hypothetical protein
MKIILLLGALLMFSSPRERVEYFLARDTTSLNEYNKYSYVCSDFAEDLVKNAESAGFKAESIVILFTHEIGHVIVAFYTDEGIIYVEPQTDTIYPLVEVGQPLCNIDWCVGSEAVRVITH